MLTEVDKVRLHTADQMHLAQDGSQSFSVSSWVARLADLPFALVLDLPRTERRGSALVLRWPQEEDYVRRAPKVRDCTGGLSSPLLVRQAPPAPIFQAPSAPHLPAFALSRSRAAASGSLLPRGLLVG